MYTRIFLVRFYIFYPAKYFIVNIEFILLIVYCEEEEIRNPRFPRMLPGRVWWGAHLYVIQVENKKKKTKTECLCFLEKNNMLFV